MKSSCSGGSRKGLTRGGLKPTFGGGMQTMYCIYFIQYIYFPGFVFDAYEGRNGESLYLDCVTDTATLVSFTHRNTRGERQEFYYSTSPTILHNFKYLLYKRSYSKLLHVYSLIITKLDYSDEGQYNCQMSDGKMSQSRVVVMGINSKFSSIFSKFCKIYSEVDSFLERSLEASLQGMWPFLLLSYPLSQKLNSWNLFVTFTCWRDCY